MNNSRNISFPIPDISPPQLLINPEIHREAYFDVADPAVPMGHRSWDLDYSPEKDMGIVSVRERGSAVYRHCRDGKWVVGVFQRSNSKFGIYRWNIALTLCDQETGPPVITDIRLNETIKSNRGQHCLRDYLYWNLTSNLLNRPFSEESLAPHTSPLRLQCIHTVELMRYCLAAYQRVQELGADSAETDSGDPLYSESEITRVLRIKAGDIFCLSGRLREVTAHAFPDSGRAAHSLRYQLSLPGLNDFLKVGKTGAVRFGPLVASLKGQFEHGTFSRQQAIENFADLAPFMEESMPPQLSRNLLKASTLNDITAYLKLAPTLRYPFGKGFNREFHQKIFKKNSFCIGWKPSLVDRDILKKLGDSPAPASSPHRRQASLSGHAALENRAQ